MTQRLVTPAFAGRLVLLALVWLSFAATDDNYRTFNNLYAMLEGFALLGLVAAGLMVTMIAGELDLSVGSVAAVAGVIAIQTAELGLIPCVLIATAAGVVFGLAQGFLIARTGINSLVFTIGTLIGVRGIAHILASTPVLLTIQQLSLSDTIVKRWWIFSPFSVTTIAVLGLLGAFLTLTGWGREIYAIGGGRLEAIAAGISLTRPLMIAFACSAGCAAMAGAIASLKSGSAAAFSYENVLLSAVTAALVGGISLYGGRGNVLGLVTGILTLRFLISGFSSRGAPTYIESLATGLLLLGVIVIEFLTESPQMADLRERRELRRALDARRATAPG
jgi:ribose/xylose/arabinose/galactoside ABC-type transport system permease subunit